MWEWETEKHSDATWQGNNKPTACVKWGGVNDYMLVFFVWCCKLKWSWKEFLNNDSNLNGTTHGKK